VLNLPDIFFLRTTPHISHSNTPKAISTVARNKEQKRNGREIKNSNI